jgi:hypothetical protein
MKQCGIYEKVLGSEVWWIRYADAEGRYRREKAGTKSMAIDLYRKRKTEALQGRKLPERLRVVFCYSTKSPTMLWPIQKLISVPTMMIALG